MACIIYWRRYILWDTTIGIKMEKEMGRIVIWGIAEGNRTPHGFGSEIFEILRQKPLGCDKHSLRFFLVFL